MDQYTEPVVDLPDPVLNPFHHLTSAAARNRLRARDPDAVRGINGSFALRAQEGQRAPRPEPETVERRHFLPLSA